jgi:integrase
MAWLFKQKRSSNWFIGWRIGKKLFNRTTGTSNRKQAEKRLALYQLMADANREQRLTEDFYCSLRNTEPKRLPLRQVAAAFLAKSKGTTAPGSFVRYRLVVDSFLEYLHADDAKPLAADITGEVIQEFLNDARGRTSAGTANFYRGVLRAMFNHAADNGKINSNPMGSIEPFKRNMEEMESARRPFEPSEVKAAYNAAPNDFWRFAIVFGLYTGLRLGNVVTLRWKNVDLEKRMINVVDIKSPDELHIPLCSPFLLSMFYELRRKSPAAKPEDYIFPEYAGIYLTKSKDGENDAAALSIEFRNILVGAKLLEKYERKYQRKGRSCRRKVSPLSFHSLRHNFISMLQARGAPQMVARELVGHDSDAVNQLYTHASEDVLRKSLKRLPEVFK